MERFFEISARHQLFNGLSSEEIHSILKCLESEVRFYAKNSIIFHKGQPAQFVGIILEGEVQTQKTDYSGNVSIISRLFPHEIIAASSCYSSEKRLPFDIFCASDCRVLCLDINHLIRPCCNACSFHISLIKNLLSIVSDKNVFLATKMDILTKRTIREKVLAYLDEQSKKIKNKRFSITLSRAQMAEYLSINRSALSRELSALRDEGIIEFDGNSFVIKEAMNK